MKKRKIITSLDIGTTKICAVVGEVSHGEINIIGTYAPVQNVDREIGLPEDMDSCLREPISLQATRCTDTPGIFNKEYAPGIQP